MSCAGRFGAGTGAPPIETITSNAGGAVGPDALGNFNLLGGNNITGTGNPLLNTVTLNLTGTTNHSLQIGNAGGSITSLGVATNGQIPIGSVGADPVLATLTAGPGIIITNGPGSITITDAGAGDILTYTNVNATPYNVLANDEFISVDSSVFAITIRLPNAPAVGRVYMIKDRTGSAGTRNISVTTVGGVVLIDGAATYTMNTDYQSINVVFNGTNYEVW